MKNIQSEIDSVVRSKILISEKRNKIKSILLNVPIGERLIIEESLLQELLFDTFEINGGKLKVPVWSGEFLSKIDLSQVDFSNVSWHIYSRLVADDFDLEISDWRNAGFSDNDLERLKRMFSRIKDDTSPSNIFVHYRDTNATINLDTSWEALHGSGVKVTGCDFYGTIATLNDGKVDHIAFCIADVALSIELLRAFIDNPSAVEGVEFNWPFGGAPMSIVVNASKVPNSFVGSPICYDNSGKSTIDQIIFMIENKELDGKTNLLDTEKIEINDKNREIIIEGLSYLRDRISKNLQI